MCYTNRSRTFKIRYVFYIPDMSMLITTSYQLPAYLKEHQSTLSSSDKSRYTSQLDCASKLVKTFDEPTYSDEDAETTAKIVALMTEVRTPLHCLQAPLC